MQDLGVELLLGAVSIVNLLLRCKAARLLGPLGLHTDPIVRRILVRLPTKFKAPALQGTPLFLLFYDAANHMALSMGVGGRSSSMGVGEGAPQKVSVTAGEMICLNFQSIESGSSTIYPG